MCASFPPDEKRLNYNVDYPIRHGIVDNWDNMEKYWQRCIYQYMSCDPEEVTRRGGTDEAMGRIVGTKRCTEGEDEERGMRLQR